MKSRPPMAPYPVPPGPASLKLGDEPLPGGFHRGQAALVGAEVAVSLGTWSPDWRARSRRRAATGRTWWTSAWTPPLRADADAPPARNAPPVVTFKRLVAQRLPAPRRKAASTQRTTSLIVLAGQRSGSPAPPPGW